MADERQHTHYVGDDCPGGHHDEGLQQATEHLRENDDDRYRPTRLALPRRVYDELDMWFVEGCTHEGRDRCSVCRTERGF